MGRILLLAGAMALASWHPVSALAATDQELEEIRAQIRELKSSYEARIQALEQRLRNAEQRAASPAPVIPAPAARAPAVTPAQVTASAPAVTPAQAGAQSLSAFNPAISAILAGGYANLSRDPAAYRLSGFPTPADVGPGRRGFSLGESELTFAANVDPKFSGALTFSISRDNSVEVEEAYGVYNGAPYGVVPKFGRFLSAVGYLNEQHAHAWDFADTPLAYQAFLGGQYRNDGVQLRWVAPTEHYVELGGELGNADAFPGVARNKNGLATGIAFARTGGDIGDSHSWLAGVSYLRTRADSRPDTLPAITGRVDDEPFSGLSRLWGAQLVWKYAPHGNPRETNFKLQGEYFWRRESGRLADPLLAPIPLPNTASISRRQGGGYVQGVYQFVPTWRAGLRYDRLDAGSIDYGSYAFLANPSFNPERSTAMVDWSPSEFSRLRLQFGQAKLVPGITDNEWFLQYILSIGAHGAHKY
ncbi:MAG TPA: TonB-dependent receptor [Usitatibacter sp.]|nr:TonB-dependent receptor [Usitatibacter sp.]